MKIKVRPEDFIVREILSISPSKVGNWVICLIEKRNTNTLDVLKDMARRLAISLSEIGYLGLKDKYSLSYQYVSIPVNKFKEIVAKNYRLSFFGYFDRPLKKDDLICNEFEITVRDVNLPSEVILKRIMEVRDWGFVNYYDEQRFGSARHGKGFVVKELIKGDFEKAMRLYIGEPSKYDDSDVKKWKKSVKASWPCFDVVVETAPKIYKRIVAFLSEREPSKSTFRKAFNYVEDAEKDLLITAYQSYIWNNTSSKLVCRFFEPSEIVKVPYFYGYMYFYGSLRGREFLLELDVPAVSPKLKVEGLLGEVIDEVLREEGINGLENFKLPLTNWLFRSYRRKFIVVPDSMEYYSSIDEVYPGKKKWVLKFRLPPGSFATVLVKRIFGAP
ncbi:MAG: tRNA pseudouridine(13) synthase TruD [candidate division WOR-3 bacterium]